MCHASLLLAMSCQSRLQLPESSDNHPPQIVSQAAIDAMEPESEDSGSEKSIDDAGNDAEVQMGDLALALLLHPPNRSQSSQRSRRARAMINGSSGSVRRKRERMTLAGLSLN